MHISRHENRFIDKRRLSHQMDPTFVYKRALLSTLNSLGTQDGTPGVSTRDLARYLQQAFSVSDEKHAIVEKEVRSVKHEAILLRVNVHEAVDIRAMDSNGKSDPYCILSVFDRSHSLPKGASPPKGSSPKNSPSSARRLRDSQECVDVIKTSIKPATLHPVWHEEYELGVTNVDNAQLHIHIWDSDVDETLLKNLKAIDQKLGIKNFIKNIRQSLEHGKVEDDFIGVVVINIKDIPAIGVERWYDIYDKVGPKARRFGQIRLSLQLELPRNEVESAECDRSATDEYYSLLSHMMEHNRRTPAKLSSSKQAGKLDSKSQRILDLFATQNQIKKLPRAVSHLVLLLELSSNRSRRRHAPEAAITNAVKAMDTCIQQEVHQRRQSDLVLKDFEITRLHAAIQSYTKQHMDATNLPRMFPLTLEGKHQLDGLVGGVLRLWTHALWKHQPPRAGEEQVRESGISTIKEMVSHKLQVDTKRWIKKVLSTLPNSSDTPDETSRTSVPSVVESQLDRLCHTIHDLQALCQPQGDTFNKIDLNFTKVSILALDKMLGMSIQNVLRELDECQKHWQKNDTVILSTAKLSLRLYLAIKDFVEHTRRHIGARQMFKMTLTDYQSWFHGCVVVWLQVFRTECTKRTIKALEIDKDFVPVSSIFRHSNSAVDILSCFVRITDEWSALDIKDPALVYMGATKITDTICDGARLYCDKMECILDNQAYYSEKETFDVTDQHCITLNNLEYIRSYLTKIPSLLRYEAVGRGMRDFYDTPHEEVRSLTVMNGLLDAAANDIVLKCERLIRALIDKMAFDVSLHVQQFTLDDLCRDSSFDSLLQYLKGNLTTLHEKLVETLYVLVIGEIWSCILHNIKDNLLHGAAAGYYRYINKNIHIIKQLFFGELDIDQVDGGRAEEGAGSSENSSSDPEQVAKAVEVAARFSECVKLKSVLHINSLSTEQLILDCYDLMAQSSADSVIPQPDVGELFIKAGILKGSSTVSLYIEVSMAMLGKAFSASQSLNPYVTVEVCPTAIFEQREVLKTHVCMETSQPIFRQSQFGLEDIPIEKFGLRGASLVFNVYNYRPFFSDDHLGEAVMSLSEIPDITAGGLAEMKKEIRPTLITLRPAKELCFTQYDILIARAEHNDKAAKQHISKRNTIIRKQKAVTSESGFPCDGMSSSQPSTGANKGSRFRKVALSTGFLMMLPRSGSNLEPVSENPCSGSRREGTSFMTRLTSRLSIGNSNSRRRAASMFEKRNSFKSSVRLDRTKDGHLFRKTASNGT